MNKSVNNVTKSVSNIAKATTGALATTTEVLADSTGVLSSSIESTPAVLKALLTVPFNAAKGYLMEAEGLTKEEAELVAYKYIKQDISVTINESAESLGKIAASMYADDEDTKA